MKHVIGSVKLLRTLKGRDVAGILHNADHTFIARLAAADRANLLIRQIAANLAVMNFSVRIQDCVGKLLRLGLCEAEHMVSQTLSALMSDAGQALKLIHQMRKRGYRVRSHLRKVPAYSGRRKFSPCAPTCRKRRRPAPR